MVQQFGSRCSLPAAKIENGITLRLEIQKWLTMYESLMSVDLLFLISKAMMEVFTVQAACLAYLAKTGASRVSTELHSRNQIVLHRIISDVFGE